MSLGKVLIVDDEPEVRQVLQEFLSGRGYDVLVAESGSEALSMLGVDQPDLVLLDVTMPGMDGVETLRRIVALQQPVSVIMVTANADIATTSKLLAMGAVDYIPKPFDLDYLDQAVSIQVAAPRIVSRSRLGLRAPLALWLVLVSLTGCASGTSDRDATRRGGPHRRGGLPEPLRGRVSPRADLRRVTGVPRRAGAAGL
jgi:CheY-like chemotaxis protein